MIDDRLFSHEYVPTPGPAISAEAVHIATWAREDAREAATRIIKHMWIIFVLLPIVAGIAFAILIEAGKH